MNILQFKSDEVTPKDLEHLKTLVNEGKNVTGLIASIIEKFETSFASDRAKKVDALVACPGTKTFHPLRVNVIDDHKPAVKGNFLSGYQN